MRDGCFTESGRPVPCPPVSSRAIWREVRRDILLGGIAIICLTVGGAMLVRIVTEPPPASLPLPTNATAVVVNVIAPTPPPVTPGILEVYVITPTPSPTPTKSPERIRIDAQKTAAALARITPTPAPCPTNAAALTQGAVCQWAMPTPTMAPTWTPSPRCLTPIPGAVCQPGGTWLGQPEPPTPIGGEQ